MRRIKEKTKEAREAKLKITEWIKEMEAQMLCKHCGKPCSFGGYYGFIMQNGIYEHWPECPKSKGGLDEKENLSSLV